MSVKIVLENAKAQLEAQKSKAYADAKAQAIARLKPEYDAYVANKKAEYDEAVKTLTVAYENALAEKKATDEIAACAYADTQVGVINSSIEQLQKLIDGSAEA